MTDRTSSKGVEESTSTNGFKALGVSDGLLESMSLMGWTAPTTIQRDSIPHAIAGRDVIGLASTGSGKTGAFAIPIVEALIAHPGARLFACVIAPNRELAYQIAETFEALGSGIGLMSVVIVGGMDIAAQALALAKRPHIVIGTPGRIVYHLQSTKGFSFKSMKFLVLDEADRLLHLEFEEHINTILKGHLPCGLCLPRGTKSKRGKKHWFTLRVTQ